MEASQLTDEVVADHYRRHCELGPMLDRAVRLYFNAYPDQTPTGPTPAAVTDAALRWAAASGTDGAYAARIADLGDLGVLAAHHAEHTEILSLLTDAVDAYVKEHGRRGLRYSPAGVTADHVRIYSVPGGEDTLIMPIAWAVAYHTALV